MEDKSIEELEAEYNALKKANLEAKIVKEQALIDERVLAEEEAKNEAAREAIRAELMEEIGSKSTVEPEEPTTLDTVNDEFQEFKDTFCKKLKLTGNPYEDYIHKIVYKDYKR